MRTVCPLRDDALKVTFACETEQIAAALRDDDRHGLDVLRRALDDVEALERARVRRVLARPVPVPVQATFDELGRPLREVEFVVVDLETTGGSAASKNALPRLLVTEGPLKLIEMYAG